MTNSAHRERGVVVNVPERDQAGELGDFFDTLSSPLSFGRWDRQGALESVIDLLGDAVAIFNADGDVLCANPLMRAILPSDAFTRPMDALPPGHPYRTTIEDTLASRQSRGPLLAHVPSLGPDGSDPAHTATTRVQLILTGVIESVDHPVAVVFVARNVDPPSHLRPRLSCSRKLAAFSRLSAGLPHEVKNPLNATVIHLELLRHRLASRNISAALEHLAVIRAQIHRLGEVIQGFLQFIGPEDLNLRPVSLAALLDELRPALRAETQTARVEVEVQIPAALPDLSADASLLRQALMHLALNACQAMPDGGRLRIAGAAAPGNCVEVLCEDSGVGIPVEYLNKVFNLFFTTKQHHAGIGLSLVYRTVQLHDGEIELQSTLCRGTTVRMLLPSA